jgi:hypothetical protein
MFMDNVANNLSCQIWADDNSSTCTFTVGKSVTYIYDGKISGIDGASVAIILCLHVLVAHHILLIWICWLFSVNIDV